VVGDSCPGQQISGKNHQRFLSKMHYCPVKWLMLTVPATWEAEARESLEPSGSRPTWATQQTPTSKFRKKRG
jgi:hypothetical protein